MRTASLVYFYIAYRFLYSFFIRYMHAPYLSLLPVNIGLMVVCGAVMLVLLRDSVPVPLGYRSDFAAFAILIVASSALNASHWLVVGKSVIEIYGAGIALFLIITSGTIPEKEQRRIVSFCYVLIMLQIPVSLGQYMVGRYPNLDSNSGTISYFELGGTGINAVLASFLMARYIAKSFADGLRLRYLVIAICSIIPVIVGGARFGLVLAPVSVLCVIAAVHFRPWVKGSRRFLGATAVVLIVAAFVMVAIGAIVARSETLSSFLDLNVILDPGERSAYESYRRAGRLSYYGMVFQSLSQTWPRVLFGLGSAAIGQSRMIGGHSMWPEFIDVRLSSGLTFFTGLGVLGLMFVAYIYLKGIVLAARFARLQVGGFMRAESLAFVSVSVVCMMASVYTDVWTSQAGMVYWVLLGVLVNRYKTAISGPSEPLMDAAFRGQQVSTTSSRFDSKRILRWRHQYRT